MGDDGKRERRRRVDERIRAHIRAAMVENEVGLSEAAKLLDEDKGALSDCLSGDPKARGPSLYLAFMVQARFDIAAKDLLNQDPEQKYFEPAITASIPRKRKGYAIKAGKPSPSGASREQAAPPAKRKTND